ncbi:bifunctional [glutamine synthetase] adenylyltransferase/[glutamine synthetase]-adenylyl-L-tyrosine phosphorylase [Paracoccus sp. Z118]|uniref:bifunctional [glutamine synthetase] adenylyltransferase/[glutamine synthetase]-adenylyl-L-tyrosine phosphorylase n=1 Tax=Paracoccus sp. Z118 TaxID=2851017 RepID=UPI001C2C5566|nr:bifunctional [glutamine synthetase] adenylyltransferase/[glutamine synthetase]-adenylyl-L-tyrosine phosphorylase [Paracoccus sp. Z118]MBV0890373.1 bifunctional [glutamine synthetase] adenylyltransferase/[glutamine synthetase]-adenylyl-L-tyrosine phosphorylase [Paracoccus sp. Z118]
MDFAARITRLPLPVDDPRGRSAAALFPDAPPRLEGLIRGAAGSSPYLAGLIEREAAWLLPALEAGDVVARETAGFDSLTSAELGPALRRAKRRVALWVALADLGGVWLLEQVTGALTGLADRATDLALRAHVADEARRGKLPAPREGASPVAAGIFALAMGKMGAGELNYSSDIDLIVLYDDTAYAPADQPEVRAALIRATRKAAATLSDQTEHGYVFRTDLRLRPDASVTPVCISAGAALAYYEAEGRSWERAAYIKARPCAGDIAAGERFLHELRPFVWRRHLDFATVQDTHDMRRRIRSHKGLHGQVQAMGHDMKLGQGGIRDIEFFTQTRQLIAGGRDPDLRARATVPALAALAAKGWLPQSVADELTGHYRRHRDIEHRIQMVNDVQTHSLPIAREAFARVAALDGASDPAAWGAEVVGRLHRVEALTGDFFEPDTSADEPPMPELAPETAEMVEGWRAYPALRSGRAQELFSRIEPQILARMSRAAHPEEALARFDSFLRGLPAGVQLFSLFASNPQLIDLLADICGTAPGLAAYLARHPEVLDAVIAGSFFAPWPGAGGLREALDAQLASALSGPAGSYERALDAARRWAHEWQFRVGVHHLRALIGADEAGGQYADIADAAIGALSRVVAQDFARRHGAAPGRGAIVMGMGSLGARQLNAQSDLDLIVIYDAGGVESSDGPRPLAARPYYARLTQALLTALSAPTASGRLYEVDMRLRPSGRQGPVATSLESFRSYQMTEAWTWEHLALTRARVIAEIGAGAEPLAQDVEALRVQVLGERGQDPRVLPELAGMRARIFASKAPDGRWEAKSGRGRLQDVELLAQSLALRAGSPARATPAQIRAGKRAELIAGDQAERLAGAHRFLWRLQCAARLLTDGALDMETVGRGGQDFLLRETGAESLDALAAALTAMVEEAGSIADELVGTAVAAEG